MNDDSGFWAMFAVLVIVIGCTWMLAEKTTKYEVQVEAKEAGVGEFYVDPDTNVSEFRWITDK